MELVLSSSVSAKFPDIPSAIHDILLSEILLDRPNLYIPRSWKIVIVIGVSDGNSHTSTSEDLFVPWVLEGISYMV